MSETTKPLLSVRELAIEFKTETGVARAVDHISFDLAEGETVGIVGESGCGKSVTALSILRLIPSPPGRIAHGQILFEGNDLASNSEREMRKIRGNQISMIFQEPMTALNPVYTIGSQLTDVLRLHKKLKQKEAREEAVHMLETVDIESPEKRLDEYPHQLSGGMRQRVMIAMALSCNPRLLIADEPTTALDVTVQAQVMEEINKLQKQFQMGVILITHDLGVIAESCQKVIVMYCGKIVEIAPTNELFRNPQHPYTKGLLHSIPRIRKEKIDRLPTIPGTVPDIQNLPQGCRFADRCPKASDQCHEQYPELTHQATRSVACYHPG